jgi:hypothetical protein
VIHHRCRPEIPVQQEHIDHVTANHQPFIGGTMAGMAAANGGSISMSVITSDARLTSYRRDHEVIKH